MYNGEAEYDTIRAVKQSVSIPVIANGDIDTPEKAKFVLDYTGADAIMIGRAAQGRPWIFREIDHYLQTGTHLPPPSVAEIRDVLLGHLHDLQILLKHVREAEASPRVGSRLAELTAYADTLERDCRQLHAEFVEARDGARLRADWIDPVDSPLIEARLQVELLLERVGNPLRVLDHEPVHVGDP